MEQFEALLQMSHLKRWSDNSLDWSAILCRMLSLRRCGCRWWCPFRTVTVTGWCVKVRNSKAFDFTFEKSKGRFITVWYLYFGSHQTFIVCQEVTVHTVLETHPCVKTLMLFLIDVNGLQWSVNWAFLLAVVSLFCIPELPRPVSNPWTVGIFRSLKAALWRIILFYEPLKLLHYIFAD